MISFCADRVINYGRVLLLDAYFWTGNSSRPNPAGIIIPYPADYQGK